jgi:hypothetical protein
MNKTLIFGTVIAGVLLVVLAILYFSTPAGSLPSYIPGYEAGSSRIHLKHGIGSLVLGLALFAFAWFRGGPKS